MPNKLQSHILKEVSNTPIRSKYYFYFLTVVLSIGIIIIFFLASYLLSYYLWDVDGLMTRQEVRNISIQIIVYSLLEVLAICAVVIAILYLLIRQFDYPFVKNRVAITCVLIGAVIIGGIGIYSSMSKLSSLRDVYNEQDKQIQRLPHRRQMRERLREKRKQTPQNLTGHPIQERS